VPSRYEPTRELRELLIKRMFLGDCAPNEREENILERTSSSTSSPAFTRTGIVQAKGCAPHEHGGSENAQTQSAASERVAYTRKCKWQLRAACAGLILIAGAVSLSACSEASSGYDYETASHHEPAKLEPIKGTDVQRVIFDAVAAKRVGLQTAPIRQNGQGKIMPYAALIYDAEGDTYAYTNPEPLTYVRQEIDIDHYDGDSVVLSDGPPAGTEVVTVGVDEVYGTEFEVEE
jgi:hypothetical protein